MDKETNLILIKIKNNLYNQNYKKKRTIKINFKFLLFTISILINIFFCLKFLFYHIFSPSEKINLNTETKKIILVNISTISSKSFNYFNSCLNNNYYDYHSDDILLEISKKLRKTITRVDTLALSGKMNIGNQLIALNNAIYFCEILKCREILVDKSIKFIKKEFFYNKFNMTIKLNKHAKCKKSGVVCLENLFFFTI